MIIVSDTSCLILLNKIGELNILNELFGEVIITTIISREFGEPLPSWIKIIDPKNIEFQNKLLSSVDIGEASAITLAIEVVDCTLILDDKDARKLAFDLGLKFSGTIGVLTDAKKNGLIPALKPIIDKIQQTDFRLSAQLIKDTLEDVGE